MFLSILTMPHRLVFLRRNHYIYTYHAQPPTFLYLPSPTASSSPSMWRVAREFSIAKRVQKTFAARRGASRRVACVFSIAERVKKNKKNDGRTMTGTNHIHTYHIRPPHFKPSRDTQNGAKMGISKSTMGYALK